MTEGTWGISSMKKNALLSLVAVFNTTSWPPTLAAVRPFPCTAMARLAGSSRLRFQGSTVDASTVDVEALHSE